MKVYLRTFGCRANQYDTEAVRAMLVEAGQEVVDAAKDADLALFNSCAVTSEAEADLRKAVRRSARDNPRLRSVVMGCAAAVSERAIRGLPSVEHVVPGADLPAIARALDLGASLATVRPVRQTGTRALLRIQDGCDEHCTFCATTIARGANRSRSPEELVEQARALAERHPEIVITGIHIGTYGQDIGSSLGALMQRLVRAVPDVRFRLSSIEATEIDAPLFELFSGEPLRLAPHLHAPLQSGSDRVLRRMGRHWYTSESYARSVERLAAACPVLGVGADVIAGFPGETEQDHAATMSLVERLPFTYLHVFPFSLRPGTPAERLGDPVPSTIARRRSDELRELAGRKAAAYAASRAGGQADVIVIGGPAENHEREGLTGDYLTTLIADPSLTRGGRFAARLEYSGNRFTAFALPQALGPST